MEAFWICGAAEHSPKLFAGVHRPNRPARRQWRAGEFAVLRCGLVWLEHATDARSTRTSHFHTRTHTHTRAHLITHDTLRCPAPTLRTDSQKSKMPEIGNTGVAFDTIAREWRCKYTGPAGESASLKVVSAHRTHFSYMSHPTFPISHLVFPVF